jgi:hypothetical protein
LHGCRSSPSFETNRLRDAPQNEGGAFADMTRTSETTG